MPAKIKSWYNIQNEAGKPVTLTIEDEIGGLGKTSKDFRADFARIGENEAVNVHLQSGGGSVFDGNEIANILGAHKGRVNISIGSICASIATVIMVARGKKDTVTAAKNSLVMMKKKL